MKVKAYTAFNTESQTQDVMLAKGKNEEEMHTHCLVGRYPWKDKSTVEQVVSDFNRAFDKMWH